VPVILSVCHAASQTHGFAVQTARADDETDVGSCRMEDCHHLFGVTEDFGMKPDWKSINNFK